jgi:hypothetical protein
VFNMTSIQQADAVPRKGSNGTSCGGNGSHTGRRALRVDEFCTAYGVSRSTANKLIRLKKLDSVLVLGRRLIPVDSAEALLRP